MIIQQFTTIKQVSLYSAVENDFVPQKVQCTECLGAAGGQVQKCYNSNKLSCGGCHCSLASKMNWSPKVLHRKWCWGAHSQHFGTQSIPSGSTQSFREKVTDFDSTYEKKPSNNNKRCICGQMCVTLLEKGDAKCSGANSEDLSYILYFIHILRVLEAAVRNILLPSNCSCWK